MLNFIKELLIEFIYNCADLIYFWIKFNIILITLRNQINYLILCTMKQTYYYYITYDSNLSSLYLINQISKGIYIIISPCIISIKLSFTAKSPMLKKIITNFDMFPALPTLRVKGQSQLVNFCGGFFSLLLLMLFTYVFIQGLISIIQYEQIIANQVIEMDRPASQYIRDLNIALGLRFTQMTSVQQYLSVNGIIRTKGGVIGSIQMAPCKRERWSMIDDDAYNRYQLQYMFCPVDQDLVKVKGYFVTDQFQFITLSIDACDNATSAVLCKTPAEINTFMDTINVRNYIIGNFLMINTAFIPTKKTPIIQSVSEQFLWLPFTKTLNMEVVIKVGEWEIKTDQSFSPIQNITTQTGHFIDVYHLYKNQVSSSTQFLRIMIFASPKKKIITRQVGKFDDLLSYLGGLFGILISFFAFFVMSFNQYRYQLWVSQGSFTFKNTKRVTEKDLNFLKFIKYSIYDWVNSFCCCSLKWNDCEAIEQTKQQAIQQIQIQHLLRRIGHLEDSLSSMMTKEEDITLYLVEPKSIDEIRKRRRTANYYSLISEGESLMTISNLKLAQGIMSFASKIIQQRNLNFQSNEKSSNSFFTSKLEGRKNIPDSQLTSLQIMDKYLGPPHSSQCEKWAKNIQLEPEDQECERELAEAFYALEQSRRSQIIQHIPLTILLRLRHRYLQRQDEIIGTNTLIFVKEKAKKDRKKLQKIRNHKRSSLQEIDLQN